MVAQAIAGWPGSRKDQRNSPPASGQSAEVERSRARQFRASLTLGAAVAAIMARFTRSSFVDILQDDYIRTARAKGLSETVVVLKHGLRNALVPVVTMMGLQFGFLLGGSIVVEVVFNWPGMGRLLIDAVDMRDYPVIQGLVLLFSLEFILINVIVDVLYAVINPTIRYR